MPSSTSATVKLKYPKAIAENQKDSDALQYEDQRDDDREFRLAGFVADQLHRQIHRSRPAERGDKQQGVFFHTPMSACGGAFVVYRDDDCEQIDGNQINDQNFQNNLGVIKCSLKE